MKTIETALRHLGDHLAALFLSPGSQYSLTSLACALVIAVVIVLYRRRRRAVGGRALFRALFPRRFLVHPSSRADLGYFLFNTFVFAGIFGAAILSFQFLSQGIRSALTDILGPVKPILPEFAARAALTLILFLGYELGYWLDHYLKHRVPFLWELHKVHHSAEVLTPLTASRMHPLDTLVFVNILGLTTAMAVGLGAYVLGDVTKPFALAGNNILLVLFIHAYVHLQHTEVWIAFRGIWGRIFLSPAHHQIHHSADPAHFNTNFGSCLALWDWLFGTLHMPERSKERLTFGVEAYPGKHTLTGEGLAPILRSALAAVSMFKRPPAISDERATPLA